MSARFVLIVLLLAGCSARPTVVEERVNEVLIPVAQACALARPRPPQSLRATISDEEWRALDLRQRAALVAAQGLRWQSYAQNVNAATAACPEIE